MSLTEQAGRKAVVNHLEPEQIDLLILLVEATRSVSGTDRDSFHLLEHMSGSVLLH